jgi:hypothetical protein
MKIDKLVFGIMLIFLVLMPFSLTKSDYNDLKNEEIIKIDSCQDIKSRGNYVLANDIKRVDLEPGACLTLHSNVKLDCLGKMVIGRHDIDMGGRPLVANQNNVIDLSGINVVGENVEINNCFVTKFNEGIRADNGPSIINGNRVTNSDIGIAIRDGATGRNIQVTNNELKKNRRGLYSRVSFINIENNRIFNNREIGLVSSQLFFIGLYDNIVCDSGFKDVAIFFQGTSPNYVMDAARNVFGSTQVREGGNRNFRIDEFLELGRHYQACN